MSSNATAPEVVPAGPGLEAVQPGLQVQEGNTATKRKPSTRDRKLSVIDPNAHIVDADDLSEADRRLAAMGYVQVSRSALFCYQ